METTAQHMNIGEIRHKDEFVVTRKQETTDNSMRVILHVRKKHTKETGFLIVKKQDNGKLENIGKYHRN